MTKYVMQMLTAWPEPEATFGRILWFTLCALFGRGAQDPSEGLAQKR